MKPKSNTQPKPTRYPTLASEDDIQKKLRDIGVDLLEPCSKMEISIAQSMREFSYYCFTTHVQECFKILDKFQGHDSVGILQGGNDDVCIYRLSFPASLQGNTYDNYDDNDEDCQLHRNDNNAAMALLHEYNTHQRQNKQSQYIFTLQHLQQYMLSMLSRRTNHRMIPATTTSTDISKNIQLGNLMLIIQWGGPTHGQIRHIDNMVSNVQVCLYMSDDCPSTIIYVPKDIDDEYDDDDAQDNDDDNSEEEEEPGSNGTRGQINNAFQLLQYWGQSIKKQQQEQQHSNQKQHRIPTHVPSLLRYMLTHENHTYLNAQWYTKYFSHWKTLDTHLSCFGKLYQDISYQLGLNHLEPGTTLLAGGNEVHAGPPTIRSRMFAFAIGIPSQNYNSEPNDFKKKKKKKKNREAVGVEIPSKAEQGEENNGEVQYNPVTLHLDVCTLLFGIMDCNPNYDNHKSSCFVQSMMKEGKEHDPYDNPLNVQNLSDILLFMEEQKKETKLFLLYKLIDFLEKDPIDEYIMQVDPERKDLIDWLEQVLNAIQDKNEVRLHNLTMKAVESQSIFYNPDIIKKRQKKDLNRNNNNINKKKSKKKNA